MDQVEGVDSQIQRQLYHLIQTTQICLGNDAIDGEERTRFSQAPPGHRQGGDPCCGPGEGSRPAPDKVVDFRGPIERYAEHFHPLSHQEFRQLAQPGAVGLKMHQQTALLGRLNQSGKIAVQGGFAAVEVEAGPERSNLVQKVRPGG